MREPASLEGGRAEKHPSFFFMGIFFRIGNVILKINIYHYGEVKMGLNFVCGMPGSGKTKKLFDIVIQEAKKNPDTTYYYIVPEQFSLQTQYDLLSVCPNGGIINIDVTSMTKLANNAFNKLSGRRPEFVSEIGKSMIIKKVLYENKDKMAAYGAYAHRAGFTASAKAMLSEMWNYNVTEEDLENVINASDSEPALKKKLTDALMIVSQVNKFLGAKLITNEGMYDAFAGILEKSGLMKKAVVVLDGFTGFTPSEDYLLSEFLRLSVDTYVSVTIDKESISKPLREFDLFHMSKETIDKLIKLSKGVIEAEPKFIFTDYDKYKTKTLSAVQKGLFGKSGGEGSAKTHADDSITVFNAVNTEEEVKIAAAEVERLVRVNGLHYSDIAILLSDPDVYTEPLERALSAVHARFFPDKKKSLQENEFAYFVKTVLLIMEKKADTDLFVSYAKCGFSGISFDDACLLENYCTSHGIKGKDFKSDFTKELKRVPKSQYVSLEYVNGIRNKIVTDLDKLIKTGKNSREKTAGEFAEMLFDFFTENKTEERLLEISENFKNTKEPLKTREYAAVFKTVSDIFDEAIRHLGNEKIKINEFREIIEAGLMEAKVGLVPGEKDQLIIGDIERTRVSHIRALFLLGANESKLFKASGSISFLTDRDKESMLKKGVELSPGRLKKAGNDRFYLYLALTRPTDFLWISYPSADAGEKLKQALTIKEVLKLYDNLSVTSIDNLDRVTRVLKNDMGSDELLKMKRDRNIARINNEEHIPEKISDSLARKIYGNNLYGSVSKFETYGKCPFRFFLNYGVDIQKKDEYKLLPPDFGNISHDALKKYGVVLLKEKLDWTEVPEEKQKEYIASCAKSAVDEYEDGKFYESEKSKYLATRVADALGITVQMMTEQLKNTDFKPYEFEKPFVSERKIPLSNGEEGEKSPSDYVSVTINGTIDRVDICDTDYLQAIKVIDYKSSDKDINLSDVYMGISLQLPVYLRKATDMQNEEEANVRLSEDALNTAETGENALNTADTENTATENTATKTFKPGAMLYNAIKDEIVKVDEKTFVNAEKIYEEVREKYKTTGLINSDPNVLKSLDYGFIPEKENVERENPLVLKPNYKSAKIPVTTGKEIKGSDVPNIKGAAISEEILNTVMDYAIKKTEKDTVEILTGNTEIKPFSKNGKVIGCKFCDYSAVCGFDTSKGDVVNNATGMKRNEIIMAMREENNG